VRRATPLLVTLLLALGVASGSCASGAAPPSPDAASVLGQLPVKGRAPKTGYRRDAFGPAWADVDHNGCDTRNDVLDRDLTDKQWRAGTHGCVVVAGTLADPYTAASIVFRKADASAVQIDHVVALSNAWQTGAFAWSEARRRQLANDPLELLAVDGPTNERKGDGDAATWLPPSRGYRCDYVARQVAVKAKWDLWVTPVEHDAMARVLSGCPDQPVPADATVPTVPTIPTTPAGSPTTTATPETTSFPNCAAARAAGAAPLRVGSPGYRAGLDQDGDGVACE
jgi:hypothetical protein